MKRYIATITAYVWAHDDQDAIKRSEAIIPIIKRGLDYEASPEVEQIHSAAFGKMAKGIKQIYPKQ